MSHCRPAWFDSLGLKIITIEQIHENDPLEIGLVPPMRK